MERAWASVVVEAVGGVGLLLRFDDYGAWSQSVHRPAGYVDHFSLIDIDPVEQLFRALFVAGLFELSHGNAGLQSERDLRSGFSVGYVPAFGLAPGLAEALRGGVVEVHLDGEFFLREQKLQQQRKALRIARGCAYEFGSEIFAQVG